MKHNYRNSRVDFIQKLSTFVMDGRVFKTSWNIRSCPVSWLFYVVGWGVGGGGWGGGSFYFAKGCMAQLRLSHKVIGFP